ncbi:MAG: cupin domain-containing protein [Archangium sp.]|nr:cupin domain-containing protein [Archangium sp.]MDP3153411.1 cupin domain-containing protein [Archangium sp.]MDP3573431.1 cupin domain-containing protein [Archangium sp.]
MTEPHDELLLLMTASGTREEAAAALEHARTCAQCRAGAPQLGVAIDALEGATVGRVAEEPQSGGVERLLARARSGRLSYFASRVAALFDISTEEASTLLARAERNEGWEEGPAPGVSIMPVNAGPKVPEAMTALVKLTGGARFPMHPHFGPERVMVLEGGYHDSAGHEVWRGEVQDMEMGTEHDFVAFDGIGCVCASVNALIPG